MTSIKEREITENRFALKFSLLLGQMHYAGLRTHLATLRTAKNHTLDQKVSMQFTDNIADFKSNLPEIRSELRSLWKFKLFNFI